MIIYTNTPIMNRFFTAGYMITHKMVNKFCAIYKEKENLTLGADILDLLKNIESEEVEQIIRINNKRKGISLEFEKRTIIGSSAGLHINYNNRYSSQVLNFGIYYGV